MIILKLPFPPSVNTYWRVFHNRAILSQAGREYKKTVSELIAINRQHTLKYKDCRLAVDLILHPPDNRRRDIDNYSKGILDSLAVSGIYTDDSQIDKLVITRGEIKEGGSVIVQVDEYVK